MSETVHAAQPATRLELLPRTSRDRVVAELHCSVSTPLPGAVLWAIAEEARLEGTELPRPADKAFYHWILPELRPTVPLVIELTRDPSLALTPWWSAQLRALDDDRILAATSAQEASHEPDHVADTPDERPTHQGSALTSAPTDVIGQTPVSTGTTGMPPERAARPLEYRPAVLAGADDRHVRALRALDARAITHAANAVAQRVAAYPCLLNHLIMLPALLPTAIGSSARATAQLRELAASVDDFLDDVVAATLPQDEPHVPWLIPPRRLERACLVQRLVAMLQACGEAPEDQRAGLQASTVVTSAVQLEGIRILLADDPKVGDALHALVWLFPVRVSGDPELTGALAVYRDALAAQLSSVRSCDAPRVLQMLMARRPCDADRAIDVLEHVLAARAVTL